MKDKNKDEAAAVASAGCLGIYLIIQIGIPVLLFIVLCMAVFRGCARMVD